MGQLSKTLKNHQTINELWLQVRKFLYKSLLNLAFLWSGTQLAISKKNKNIFCYQTTNFLKIWFLFLFHKKERKRDKSLFVTKFIAIKVKIISFKNFLVIAIEIFATQLSFTDHLKHNILNKTTCRMPSAKELLSCYN